MAKWQSKSKTNYISAESFNIHKRAQVCLKQGSVKDVHQDYTELKHARAGTFLLPYLTASSKTW